MACDSPFFGQARSHCCCRCSIQRKSCSCITPARLVSQARSAAGTPSSGGPAGQRDAGRLAAAQARHQGPAVGAALERRPNPARPGTLWVAQVKSRTWQLLSLACEEACVRWQCACNCCVWFCTPKHGISGLLYVERLTGTPILPGPVPSGSCRCNLMSLAQLCVLFQGYSRRRPPQAREQPQPARRVGTLVSARPRCCSGSRWCTLQAGIGLPDTLLVGIP